MAIGRRGSTPKQAKARKHNWMMYCLGKVINNYNQWWMDFLLRSPTATDQSRELAMDIRDQLKALQSSLVNRVNMED